jgi:hypothetical protein
MASEDRVWHLTSRVRLDRSPGSTGGILFDTTSATICSANESAMDLLDILRNGADSYSLVDKLTSDYQVSLRRAVVDVDQFLHQLKSRRLVDGQD